jgi:hypothetical protein
MRTVLGIVGAVAGGIVGLFSLKLFISGGLADAGAGPLIAWTALFVVLVVGGAWVGAKLAK